eukprot:CAMPEP_0202971640 /NCGR_PEP_ID=MMETSP1396-20130829/28963_1 /ASSEMBLY_ACC=CAM_ASM_000872 /TAXON_ID= /ORGANISM="Pseudokeronopsis sp., Strain Brazil" /LENGTH=40 /DNA_ID= /DNA_START= /DNA_END= /DNA_ORIENTATION=
MAEAHCAAFMETSAKEGLNVDLAFRRLIMEIHRVQQKAAS